MKWSIDITIIKPAIKIATIQISISLVIRIYFFIIQLEIKLAYERLIVYYVSKAVDRMKEREKETKKYTTEPNNQCILIYFGLIGRVQARAHFNNGHNQIK